MNLGKLKLYKFKKLVRSFIEFSFVATFICKTEFVLFKNFIRSKFISIFERFKI